MSNRTAKKIEQVATEDLIAYARNARTHSAEQVQQIATSIETFGFNNPILIDEHNQIIAGHGRVMAAKQLGLDTVPCIRLLWLDDAHRRAYILADNKIAENSGWDQAMLESELEDLAALDIDAMLLGFDFPEELQNAKPAAAKPAVETAEVNDVFWINITGPLKNQHQALDKLREVMASLEPVTVTLGTISRG